MPFCIKVHTAFSRYWQLPHTDILYISIKVQISSIGRFSPPAWQVWTEPEPNRTMWTSVGPAWLACTLLHSAAASSLARPARLFTNYKQTRDSDEPPMQQRMSSEHLNKFDLIGHSDIKRNLITFSGWLKEFSSITLSDVRTVTVDPTALTLASSPVVAILTITACHPKFTICTGAFEIKVMVSPSNSGE